VCSDGGARRVGAGFGEVDEVASLPRMREARRLAARLAQYAHKGCGRSTPRMLFWPMMML
ncbi:MAG: hypothetical protein ACREDL_01600, partial [Bradyrhizobium sp.]